MLRCAVLYKDVHMLCCLVLCCVGPGHIAQCSCSKNPNGMHPKIERTALLSFPQVRADLRHVCLEALCEKTPEGQRAVALRKEADHLLERFQKV